MHPTLRLLSIILVAVAALAGAPRAAAQKSVPGTPVRTTTPSSTSATGQFVIHGSDLATRGAFCLLCDDVAAALGKLLRDDGRYALPIVVVLKAPTEGSLTGPAVTWNISQLTHGGFHLQLNATLRGEFRADDFARDLVRLLLAERILRNQKELKTSRQNVLPNWVLTGVTNALEFRGRSRPSVLFAAVFRSGQIYSIDKVLSADPAHLDALARGIYETSACALVLALLDQQDGPLRFAKFLDALARVDKPDRDLLRQMFPNLGASKNSLEKWWSLQMAALATPSPLETLGVDETEGKLRDALTLVLEPLPEKRKDKKSGSSASKKGAETPAKGAPSKDSKTTGSDESKKDDSRKSLFNQPASSTPLIGGKKILFLAVDPSNTDGEAAEKKTAKPGDDPPKAATKAPESKPAATTAPPAAKEEPAKRNMLNPKNWFRGKEKPAEEPARKDPAPAAKKAAPAEPKKEKSKEPEKKRESAPEPPKAEPEKSEPPAAPEAPAAGPKTTGPTLDDFATVWARPDRDKILQRNLNQLNSLKVQAHPLFRPLIQDYATVVRQLLGGKQKGVPEKLAELREQRAKILELARAVESHLDWYEAEQTRTYSGLFDDYLKVGDQMEREIHGRGDALSKYLDTIAKEYGN